MESYFCVVAPEHESYVPITECSRIPTPGSPDSDAKRTVALCSLSISVRTPSISLREASDEPAMSAGYRLNGTPRWDRVASCDSITSERMNVEHNMISVEEALERILSYVHLLEPVKQPI